jgi:hypothetical protein
LAHCMACMPFPLAICALLVHLTIFVFSFLSSQFLRLQSGSHNSSSNYTPPKELD